MARKARKKYRKAPVTWGVVGRLPNSYCSHMVPVSKERAKALLTQNTGPRSESRWDRRGAREWNLPFHSTNDMAPGYRYAEMYVYAVRG